MRLIGRKFQGGGLEWELDKSGVDSKPDFSLNSPNEDTSCKVCESRSTHHSASSMQQALTFNTRSAATQKKEEKARALTPHKTPQAANPETRCIIPSNPPKLGQKSVEQKLRLPTSLPPTHQPRRRPALNRCSEEQREIISSER